MRSRRRPLDRGQQHRMLRETTPPNFLDASLEWRRIFLKSEGRFWSWRPAPTWWRRRAVAWPR